MLTEPEIKVLKEPFKICVNVAQLLKEATGSSRHYQLDELTEGTFPSTMVGEVTLVRSQRGILVKAFITTQVEVICSRCLSPVELKVSFSIEEEFLPTVDVFSGMPLSLPDEPGSFSIDKNHVLDLTEALRQYLLLAIPMKPLCQPNCAGLCSVCGYNLNLGTCNCSKQTSDQRWSKLKKFRFEKGS